MSRKELEDVLSKKPTLSSRPIKHKPLKSESHFPKKKKCFICFNVIPLKMIKNAFYFILKAKIFRIFILTF